MSRTARAMWVDTFGNPVLRDARMYRAERLRMANPKGWQHVAHQFDDIAEINPWDASEEDLRLALHVLTRLALLEKVGKGHD